MDLHQQARLIKQLSYGGWSSLFASLGAHGIPSNLKTSMSSFPTTFATQKVVPSLVQALDYGGPSSSTILPIILQASQQLSSSDYASIVVGPVVKLFSKPDRAIRMSLLEGLPEYIRKVDDKTVTDKIWPDLQTGFSDTVPIVREATVRAIAHIHTKLSNRILNNDLLRLLAKMQLDPEASIRTNTCILIARLGPSLGYHTKKKVLVPAFARALKDSFVHARVAGLSGFIATVDCFDAEDLATKVLPVIVTALVDKEK
jgi:SCY1-like protein 1